MGSVAEPAISLDLRLRFSSWGLAGLSVHEGKRHNGGSRRHGDLLLTIQGVSDRRRFYISAGLKVPKGSPCACIQRDEVTLGVSGEYQIASGSEHARRARLEHLVTPHRPPGGGVYS